MLKQEYTLEEISYSRKEDRKIMESVLNRWFINPKTLNFVSPDFNYPFKFNKWLNLYYLKQISTITTIILKHNDWIIGHISIHIEGKNGRIFHLFIDPSHRRKGLGKKLVKEIENYGNKLDVRLFQTKIQKKNTVGYLFKKKLGYAKSEKSSSNSIKMLKQIY